MQTSIITLYRGELATGQQGHYFSPDREWTRQFTQSGQDSEIRTIQIDSNLIYRSPTLPEASGIDDQVFDQTVAEAKRLGKKAIWVDEGKGQPNSVFIFDKSIIQPSRIAEMMNWYRTATHSTKTIDINVVRNLLEQDQTIQQIAEKIGVSRQTLTWHIKKYPDLYELAKKNRNKAHSENAKKQWQGEDYRKLITEQIKERWANPEFRQRMVENFEQLRNTPDYSEISSQRTTLQWQNPEVREKMMNSIRERWADPEFQQQQSEKSSERLKQQWLSPEFRRQRTEDSRQRALEFWENNDFWNWLSKFPDSKQKDILRAMGFKAKHKSIAQNTYWCRTALRYESIREAQHFRKLYYEDAFPHAKEAYRLAGLEGINILSDKDLFVVMGDERQLIAAAWTSWVNGEFSFDIVVHPEYQRQGIGNQLTDECISEFEQTKEAYGDDAHISLHVVNPVMEATLARRGFVRTPNSSGRNVYYEMRPVLASHWYHNALFKEAQLGLTDKEIFRRPLQSHLRQQLAEYNPNQLLMFGLTMEDFMNSVIDKAMNLLHIEWSEDWNSNPNGDFYFDPNSSMGILIEGINMERYQSDRAHAGYAAYTDSVIFHELAHAVDFFKKLFDKANYDRLMLGKSYYNDPEEQRAYSAQMIHFLHDTLGISRGRVLQLMQRYTTDPSKVREDSMRELYPAS